MIRKATAAALSAALLVLVPGVQAERPTALTTSPDVRVPVDLALPPEGPPPAPTVIAPGSRAGSWSGRFRARPAASVSLSSAVLSAYQRAVAVSPPGCHLTVSLLAAIGQVESGNLAGHHLDAGNRAVPAIFGPVLDGRRFRAVADTDAGRWDGNTRWDRALGPLQFIPSSWRVAGVDLDGDGVRDPQDIFDAAGAAMVYLCAGGRDLATDAGLRAAILSYNPSAAYLALVLAWKAAFDEADLSGWGSEPLALAWSAIRAAPADPGPSASVVPTSHPARPRPSRSPAPATSPAVVAGPAPATTNTPTSPPAPAAAPAPPDPTTAPATTPAQATSPTPASDPSALPDACPTPTEDTPAPTATAGTTAQPAGPGENAPTDAVSPTSSPRGPDPVPDPCVEVPGHGAMPKPAPPSVPPSDPTATPRG